MQVILQIKYQSNNTNILFKYIYTITTDINIKFQLVKIKQNKNLDIQKLL